MARLAVAGLILTLTLGSQAALAQSDSRVGAPPMPAAPVTAAPMAAPMAHSRGGERWSRVPGGMRAYQRPGYGYTLPRYWVAPSFYISNWSAYGLPRPASGFGWSRYYDDAVLTDRYGRVYDWRDDADWSRDPRWASEDYDDNDGYRDDRQARGNDGATGAIVGAVVGGIAGNVIGGDGNRLAGTLLGSGVGALAGAAIDKGSMRDRGRDRDYSEGGYRGSRDVRAKRQSGGRYSYDGTWTGSWDGGPVRTYQGRFDGTVRPHWDGGEYAHAAPQAYAYGPSTVTTTTTQKPCVKTRTVSYVTTYVTVPAKRRAKNVRLTGKNRYLGS